MDPGDKVLAEQWMRLTIEREPGSQPPKWRVIHSQRLPGSPVPEGDILMAKVAR